MSEEGFSDERMIRDFVLKAIPCYVFWITAALRFYVIRDFGDVRARSYPKTLVAKILVHLVLQVVYIAFIVYAFTTDRFWLKDSERVYALIYTEYLLTWFISLLLLVLQHVKGLAEVFYCHKLYWLSAFVVQIAFIIIYSEHKEEIYFTLQVVNFVSLFVLNVLVGYQSLCVKKTSLRANRLLSDPPVRDANFM